MASRPARGERYRIETAAIAALVELLEAAGEPPQKGTS
jgi:hypothetical protein